VKSSLEETIQKTTFMVPPPYLVGHVLFMGTATFYCFKRKTIGLRCWHLSRSKKAYKYQKGFAFTVSLLTFNWKNFYCSSSL